MNALEVNALLAKAAMIDPRSRPSSPAAQADQATEWAAILANVHIEDALAALRTHLAESPEVVKPFHIIAGVKRIVAEHNHRQASRAEVQHGRTWSPAPSRGLLERMSAAWNDPVQFAALRTEYFDELRDAGHDPDNPSSGLPPRPPSWDGRGQGKDFAMPVHDRD